MGYGCFWMSEPCMLQNMLRFLKGHLLGEVFYKLPPPQEGFDVSHVILRGGEQCKKQKQNCDRTAFCIIFEFQILQRLPVPGISTIPRMLFFAPSQMNLFVASCPQIPSNLSHHTLYLDALFL